VFKEADIQLQRKLLACASFPSVLPNISGINLLAWPLFCIDRGLVADFWYINIATGCQLLLLLGEIDSRSTSHFAYCVILCIVWSVVCLSVVCHIRAPCLNRSTDLHGTWQVHLWGPVTHCVCVRWRVLTAGRGRCGGRTPPRGVNLHSPIYDSPGGSTDQRFRLLSNDFDHLLSVSLSSLLLMLSSSSSSLTGKCCVLLYALQMARIRRATSAQSLIVSTTRSSTARTRHGRVTPWRGRRMDVSCMMMTSTRCLAAAPCWLSGTLSIVTLDAMNAASSTQQLKPSLHDERSSYTKPVCPACIIT